MVMTMADTDARPEAELLFRLECEIDGFLVDWSHCDLLAEYIGHSVSMQAPDSFYAGNLVSTVLNALPRDHLLEPWGRRRVPLVRATGG